LHTERKCDDVDEGAREVDEGKKNEADKCPYWSKDKHDAFQDLIDGPPDNIQHSEDYKAHVGHDARQGRQVSKMVLVVGYDVGYNELMVTCWCRMGRRDPSVSNFFG
jgi:hypothetical protein